MKDLNKDDFKVEELEQRLEMGKWSNESNYACKSGDCRGTMSARYTWRF